MATMKALTIPQTTPPAYTFAHPCPPSALELTTLPVPTPNETQYLIRIHATAISRYELTWEGTYTSPLQPRIPCFDISGTIVSLPLTPTASAGSKEARPMFEIGDEVFGLLPWDGQGGMAEFAVAEDGCLARIPRVEGKGDGEGEGKGGRFEVAASLPRAVLTAWQALRVREGGVVGRGMDVLVTGAAGAVGRFGVQIARDLVGPKNEGGRVVGYGGTGDDDEGEEFADFTVQHRNSRGKREEDWVAKVRQHVQKFDVIFDTVGGKVFQDCLTMVKDGGWIITVGSPVPKWGGIGEVVDFEKGVKGMFFIVEGDGEQLGQVSELVNRGTIRPAVGKVVEGLTEEGVRRAWELWSEDRHSLKGGVVVRVYGSDDTAS